MFGMFNISAIGTVLGAFIATFVFGAFVPHLYKIAGMITGSYIGGGVNFVAMTAAFNAPENITNATIVADNVSHSKTFLFTDYDFFANPAVTPADSSDPNIPHFSRSVYPLVTTSLSADGSDFLFFTRPPPVFYKLA